MPGVTNIPLKLAALKAALPAAWLAAGLACLASFEARAEEDEKAYDRSHWSIQPRATLAPPEFSAAADRDWLRNAIDAFVLAGLKPLELQPAPEADRRSLIRRLTFDLTGLPPTPAEVEAFFEDPSPLAYENVVERLLASPHYGERWGQHWLDVVRYAETEGFEYDNYVPGLWRYRD